MEYENNEVEATRKSKYNSGVAKEMRRNDLWKDANTHSRNGQYSKWNEDLDCIWSELVADTKKKNLLDDKKTEFNKFNELLSKLRILNDSFNQGFKEPNLGLLKKRNEHYKILRDKEVFLRLLEEEVGKGTAWEDDDEDEF